MQELEGYQERLKKLENNCSLCHAKLCNICPNNKAKRVLREKLGLKKKNFLKKMLEMIKGC
ncbi:hypothetical protein [Fusobacterium sp. SYSU M8A802]